MFSSRLPPDLESNAFARALELARAGGRTLVDLTITNPTQAGITYLPGLFDALSGPRVAHYAPHPFGLEEARRAVAADYRRRAVEVPWDRIILTASTSEAYSLLFKLLCEPSGDSVLVPTPSYPLFEHLTRLDGVAPRAYQLDYAGRWSLDAGSLDANWDPRTKAILAVSPNNPTGSLLACTELAALRTRCADRGAALILDEVFADYPFEPSSVPPASNTDSGAAGALTFRLGGLSKSAALPQLKLGWIAVEGPDAMVTAALERLELICDTYLSVSTPVQVAAEALIAGGAGPRAQVLDRVRANYTALRAAAAAHPSVEVLNSDAGWSAVLRVPSRATEEEIVLDLLQRDGIVVHPGFFFDFPREAYLVLSLLPRSDAFRSGVRTILERVDA
jgi:hypothetical protein